MLFVITLYFCRRKTNESNKKKHHYYVGIHCGQEPFPRFPLFALLRVNRPENQNKEGGELPLFYAKKRSALPVRQDASLVAEQILLMSSDEFKKGKKSNPLFEEGLNVTINCWVSSTSHPFV